MSLAGLENGFMGGNILLIEIVKQIWMLGKHRCRQGQRFRQRRVIEAPARAKVVAAVRVKGHPAGMAGSVEWETDASRTYHLPIFLTLRLACGRADDNAFFHFTFRDFDA